MIKIWEPLHYSSVRGEKRAWVNFLMLREFLGTPIICSIDVMNCSKKIPLESELLNFSF